MTSPVLCIGFIKSCENCCVLGIFSSKYLCNRSSHLTKASVSMQFYLFYVIYICIVSNILDTHVFFLLLIAKNVSFNKYVWHQIKGYLALNQSLFCSAHMLHCTHKRTSYQWISSETFMLLKTGNVLLSNQISSIEAAVTWEESKRVDAIKKKCVTLYLWQNM